MRSPYRIVFVCLGNICRSPMADVVMHRLVDDAGLADRVEIASAGTGDWHIGEAADPRTLEILTRHGYDGSTHRARQFTTADFDDYDLIVAMDDSNVAGLREIAPPGGMDKVRLLLSYDETAPVREVPDPWYGGEDGFATALALVQQGCRALLDEIADRVRD